MPSEKETSKCKKDEESSQLYHPLSNLEILLYSVTWVYGAFMACYSLYIASQEQAAKLKTVNMVTPWWNIWSSSLMKKDSSDHEWNIWKLFLLRVGAFMAIYPVMSNLWKIFVKDALLFNAFFGVALTTYLIGMFPTLFLFLQIVVMWLAYHSKSTKVVWAVSICYLICVDMYPLKTMKDSLFPVKESRLYFEGPITSVLLSVMNMRCVSFALDRIWYKVEREAVFTSFLMLTAFCFYPPLLVFGPQVSSMKFKESLNKPLQSLNRAFWVHFLIQCMRYGLWFAVTDISLYFMYQQAFSIQPDTVNSLDLWALCGMGYFALHFFQLKYTVMYGLTGFLGNLDNVAAPPHPKCFARFHLFSDYYKHFDSGFYLFIKQYIYLPVQISLSNVKLNRLCASAACFGFMFIWHGNGKAYHVFIWCSLNFLCSTCEMLARSVGRKNIYQQWESYLFGPAGVRRLHAFLASPLILVRHISCLYYFFHTKVSNIFAWRIFIESWPLGFPTILFFLYCCAQVSIEFKNYQIMKNKKKAD